MSRKKDEKQEPPVAEIKRLRIGEAATLLSAADIRFAQDLAANGAFARVLSAVYAEYMAKASPTDPALPFRNTAILDFSKALLNFGVEPTKTRSTTPGQLEPV